MTAPLRLPSLLREVRACTICEGYLPHRPRPVLQADARARILIAGQAPGRKAHSSGVPFDDASGKRLRQWLGITCEQFYDPKLVAILPMGFCYPGSGSSGDLPPRGACAPQWRARLLQELPNIELTLVIGLHAMPWHLPNANARSLTDNVRSWRKYWPAVLPLPHPSPRNNIWLQANPWFVDEVLPAVQTRVRSLT